MFKTKITIIILLLFLPVYGFSCKCVNGSCTLVKKTVSKAVKQTINTLQDNDKNIYAKKLHELNEYMKKINKVQKKIELKEKDVKTEEKAEAYFLHKKNFFLNKMVKLQIITYIANKIASDQSITENELLLFKKYIQESNRR